MPNIFTWFHRLFTNNTHSGQGQGQGQGQDQSQATLSEPGTIIRDLNEQNLKRMDILKVHIDAIRDEVTLLERINEARMIQQLTRTKKDQELQQDYINQLTRQLVNVRLEVIRYEACRNDEIGRINANRMLVKIANSD